MISMNNPRMYRRMMNLWPPFLGAGIKIEYIADDWLEVKVRLKPHWYNRNAVNAHFGGSLYAMADPFYMLMYLYSLGREYIVWDQSASIDFRKPGKGVITAHFKLTAEHLEQVKNSTTDGSRYRPEHTVQLLNEQQQVIAEVHKTIYIRRKKRLDSGSDERVSAATAR